MAKGSRSNPAEKELRERELRYRRLFETAKDAILIIDADTGKILDANPCLTGLLGYSLKELIGKQLWEISPFRCIAKNKGQFSRLRKEKYVRYERLPLETKKGKVAEVEVVSNVYNVAEKKLIRCNIRNVTDRKKAEAKLRESEEKYRSLVELSPLPILVHRAGKIVFINPAAVNALDGKSKGDFIGKGFLKFMHPADRKFVAARIAKIYKKRGNMPPLEERFITLKGREIILEVGATPVVYRGLPASQVVFKDITQNKAAEKALRESEEKYRTLVETLNEGIWSIDAKGKTTFANPAIARLLGYGENELLGRRAFDFLDKAGRKKLKAMLKQKKGKIKKRYELEFYKKDGKRMRAAVSATPVKGDRGKVIGALAGIMDITAEKAAEEELRKAYAELMKIDEMKDDFMNIAAHELKTPLVTVIGYLDLLLSGREGKLSSGQNESLEIAYRNARQLQALIRDILDITKLESGTMRFEMKKLDPAQAVKDASRDFRPRAREKGLYLKTKIPKNTRPIVADRARVIQALANLLDNAVKFTKKGGITVSLRHGKGRTFISVSDTGPGIKESELKKLFTKFFVGGEGPAKKGGTGLGLVVSKGIALAHGGDILVSQTKGKGATFILKLSDKAKLPVPGIFAKAVRQETSLAGKRLLGQVRGLKGE